MLLGVGLLWCIEPARTPGIPVTAPVEFAAPPTVTATPFQPVTPTATLAATEAPPDGSWFGIDFADTHRRITVDVAAPDLPVQVDFRPGWPCAYINGTACVGLYEDAYASVLLVTVHSGVGGDGQPLRHALEGTGWNSAGLPLSEIAGNLQKLRGAPVSLRQGEVSAEGMRIITALRVPPEGLAGYMEQPITEMLVNHAQADADLAQAIHGPLLVIETCGWRHLDETANWLADDTTGSIYLLVIGR